MDNNGRYTGKNINNQQRVGNQRQAAPRRQGSRNVDVAKERRESGYVDVMTGRRLDGRVRVPVDKRRQQEPDRRSSSGTGQRRPEEGRRPANERQRKPDSGRRSADDRQRRPDSGRRPVDDGQRIPASGRHSADDRQRRPDSGRHPADDRQRRPDSGRRPADDRQRRPDSGRRPADDRQMRPDSSRRPAGDRQRRPDRDRCPVDDRNAAREKRRQAEAERQREQKRREEKRRKQQQKRRRKPTPEELERQRQLKVEKQARRKARLEKLARIFKIILKVLLVLVILCAIALVCIRSLYKLKTINVTGTSHYTDQEMVDIVTGGNDYGNTLLFLLESRMNPAQDVTFIDKIDVEYVDRNTISITVYEKAMAGCIRYDDQYAYFDGDGIVLEISAEKLDDVPCIEGLTSDNVEQGSKLDGGDESFFQEILTMTQLIYKNDIKIDKITYDDDQNLILHKDGIKIKIGGADNLESKFMNLENILKPLEGKKGTLDMSNYSNANGNVIFKENK